MLGTVMFDHPNGGPGVGCKARVRGQVRPSFVGVWAQQLWRSTRDYLWLSCVRLLTLFKHRSNDTALPNRGVCGFSVHCRVPECWLQLLAVLILCLEHWAKRNYFHFEVKLMCHSLERLLYCLPPWIGVTCGEGARGGCPAPNIFLPKYSFLAIELKRGE
jgi:hypothetical protein